MCKCDRNSGRSIGKFLESSGLSKNERDLKHNLRGTLGTGDLYGDFLIDRGVKIKFYLNSLDRDVLDSSSILFSWQRCTGQDKTVY